MADSFKPPPYLDINDGNVAENFKKWKRQFEVYLLASGASDKEGPIQTAILLHSAGPHILEIYDQFTWEHPNDKNKPDKVLQKLESYCTPRKSEVLESHRFWQIPYHEPFDIFLTELKSRASGCNFQDTDRMIRDKIVFTVSGKLQELLLREDNLCLQKAIQICRAYEQSNKYVQEIRDTRPSSTPSNVAQVKSSYRTKSQRSKFRPQSSSSTTSVHVSEQSNTKSMTRPCKFCGQFHEFKREKCPAWGKTCSNCGGTNHFSKRCRRKRIHAVTTEHSDADDNSDEFWLSYVQAEAKSKITAKMKVNNCDVNFQLDTGAEINTINQKFVKKSQVMAKNTKLRMWNHSIVNSLGETTLKITNCKTNTQHEVKFMVVPNGFQCLLGLRTVQAMNLIQVNDNNFIAKVERDLGDLGEVKLKIEDGAIPVALPARNIPLAIKDKVKEEIDKLVERGILVNVTEPTEWVNQMAVVRKANGNIRICIDPQPLNKVLVRERYKLPTFDDILPELNNARTFTKLDVQEAFWHVRLDQGSSRLTTMITPFGRFRWSRLPFGLSVSSEIFQRKLHESLSGLDGVLTIADDIIVAGCGETDENAQADQSKKLEALYKRCEQQNIVLNEHKKDMGKSIIFHGHKVTTEGILPDQDKIAAILQMDAPDDVSGVRRICGLVQYMSRFLPDLASILEPLRRLTRKNFPWNWNTECSQAFQTLKEMLTQAPVLAYYDPSVELVLQVDSSKAGLGAVLLQKGKPIEFASRLLTESERKWAQIEKEALSVLFGLERFDQYTYARKVIIHNDHKPLENILRKPLNQAPKRLQDIIMKLYRYDFDFQFVAGKDLVIADTLSRAYKQNNLNNDQDSERPRILNLNILEEFPDKRITEIKQATEEDDKLCLLKDYIVNGWPPKIKVRPDIREYYSIRDTLSVEKGVILKGEAVLIPKSQRKQILLKLHSSHLGYDSLCRRARGTVFWIGINHDIKNLVKHCVSCEQHKPKNQREPLRQHSDGKRPWDKIATDLFMIENRNYLVVVDYFTNFIEVDYLPSTTSNAVIEKMKKLFTRFGIPREIISDGGPQYTSAEFQKLVEKWGILHHVTSPNHPRSNGKAESAVKTVKNLMLKCLAAGTDQSEALLEQHNTPRQDTGLSPFEMMFGWKARTMLPGIHHTVPPSNKRLKRKQTVKSSHDRKSKNLEHLNKGQSVFFEHRPDRKWMKGKITNKRNHQYIVEPEVGPYHYHRNRVHIRPTEIPYREYPLERLNSDPVHSTTQLNPEDKS